MKAIKWALGFILSILLFTFGFCFTKNHNISTPPSPTTSTTSSSYQEPKADTRIPLSTAFNDPIPDLVCATQSPPTNNDVLSYLNSIVVGNPTYADVINDINIDNIDISNKKVSISALPKSRKYQGQDSFNYSLPIITDLSSIFQSGKDDLGANGNWDAQPSNLAFLTKLKEKLYVQLNINQVRVSIQSDATSLGGLNYQVQITAIPHSTLYSGSAFIKYQLNDNRKELTAAFKAAAGGGTNKYYGEDSSKPFDWANTPAFSTYDPVGVNILNTICQTDKINVATISAYTWSLTIDTTKKIVTLNVSNNPYYLDSKIDLYYQITSSAPFTWDWDEILNSTTGYGRGSGWSALSASGKLTFIPMDLTNHYVYVIAQSGFSAENLIIGSKIYDKASPQQQWTITGLAGNGDPQADSVVGGTDSGAFYVGVTLTGSVTLPSTLTYMGRNTFRNKGITSIYLNEGLQSIATHSCAFIGCDKLTTISVPSTVSALGGYMFAGSNLSSIYLNRSTQIYPAKYAYNSPTPTCSCFFGTNKFTNGDPRTGRIYVPENLLSAYINDAGWQSVIGSKAYCQQVFQGVKKLSDALIPQFNLGDITPAPGVGLPNYLSLLCSMSNISSDTILDYPHTITMDTTKQTITISVTNNPHYYGTAVISYTLDAFNYFDVAYNKMNGDGGWSGYTAGTTRFYIVDETNKYVEFIDSAIDKQTTRQPRSMAGNNCVIGNTITNPNTRTQYTVIAPYMYGENGWSCGFGNYYINAGEIDPNDKQLTGSLTIGKNIKFLPRDSFRHQSQITSLNFENGSQCEWIGPCALFTLLKCLEIDLPPSIKNIYENALGDQPHASIRDQGSTKKIQFNSNSLLIPSNCSGTGTPGNWNSTFMNYITVNNGFRLHVPSTLLNAYRNNEFWVSKFGSSISTTIVAI